jgi:predicted nuclease of restriction endonuclease-like (RecB) superfamily
VSKTPAHSLRDYTDLLRQVKSRIRQAQTKAILSANAEMIRLYWDIGQLVLRRQETKGWGKSVIPRLARDIRNDLPEMKGFSERNIGYMIRFAKEYPILQQRAANLPPARSELIVPQPVAQLRPDSKALFLHPPSAKLLSGPEGPLLQQPAAKLSEESRAAMLQRLAVQLPWFHNVLLFEKVKDLDARLWYMQATLQNGWSRNILFLMIGGKAHQRQGKAITNFTDQLPPAQSDLAIQALKDPYIFDFLTLEEPFHERELETHLLRHLEKFLIELGQGFAFVGRQYHVVVGDEDFYVDLLFYHLHLRAFIVIDLKKGAFKAEYAGKMNFYLNVIDDKLRHATDSSSIGLILCQDRNRIVAEYALRGMNKPIGISEYQLTRALPKELQSSLPSIEQIEAELATETGDGREAKAEKKRPLKKRRKQ